MIAGFLGTALMTVSQLIEMKITRREASFTPAIIISRIFRIPFERLSERNKVRLNWTVHIGYGTLLGLTVPVLMLFIQNLFALALINFIVVWGQGLIMVPLLGGHSPPWKWGLKWLFLDGFHHFVLSTATAVLYLTLLL